MATMPLMPSFKRKREAAKVESVEETAEPSVLDLPERAIESILARLPPAELRSMAAVCQPMRERCRGDHLWDRHMSEKWGRVLGNAAREEWRMHLASGGAVPDDSVMSWYLSMESGKLWFPAQVYCQQLSCLDAELCYDSHTDTFRARYPLHGRQSEDGVRWDRVRAPPVDTLAHDLHVSDCLHELRPGDSFEIQWRMNKESPYSWWYGVAGHLELCDGNERFCRCHLSDTVVLEFNQYRPGSRWRQALVNRKEHWEQGNKDDGFYGGIRKLRSKDEISKWRKEMTKISTYNDMLYAMTTSIDRLSQAIKKANSSDTNVPEDLWDNMMDLPGFDEAHLAHYYAYLCENVALAQAFNKLSISNKLVWVTRYIARENL